MQRKKLGVIFALLSVLVLSACGTSEAEVATQTAVIQQVRTQAVMTYQAQTTQTALANPTVTPTTTQTPTTAPTFSAPTASSPIALGTAPTAGGQSSACYGLAFVSDVTIPDGTQMTPGQSFTKTWRVTNSGTCAWEAGFKWNIVAGDAMGATAVTLNQRVEAGRQYEFSVPMIAPTNKTGNIRGTWRLSDANGNFFGDSPWVEITVGGTGATSTTGATAAATTAVPATSTPTSTNTP
jgi:hypothetical protein